MDEDSSRTLNRGQIISHKGHLVNAISTKNWNCLTTTLQPNSTTKPIGQLTIQTTCQPALKDQRRDKCLDMRKATSPLKQSNYWDFPGRRTEMCIHER